MAKGVILGISTIEKCTTPQKVQDLRRIFPDADHIRPITAPQIDEAVIITMSHLQRILTAKIPGEGIKSALDKALREGRVHHLKEEDGRDALWIFTDSTNDFLKNNGFATSIDDGIHYYNYVHMLRKMRGAGIPVHYIGMGTNPELYSHWEK